MGGFLEIVLLFSKGSALCVLFSCGKTKFAIKAMQCTLPFRARAILMYALLRDFHCSDVPSPFSSAPMPYVRVIHRSLCIMPQTRGNKVYSLHSYTEYDRSSLSAIPLRHQLSTVSRIYPLHHAPRSPSRTPRGKLPSGRSGEEFARF